MSPDDQDGNYVAELTMTQPFPDGIIDSPELIGMASKKDCWKQPTSQPDAPTVARSPRLGPPLVQRAQ